MSETHHHHHHHEEEKDPNIVGKLLTLIQLIASVAVVVLAWSSRMLPAAWLVVLSAGLLILFGVTFGMQFLRSKVLHVIGVVISLVIAVILIIISVYLYRVTQTMSEIGGANYKTDNMVVVVLENDPAETILDAKNYRFGDQTMVDQNNTELMIEDVENVVGRELKMIEYDTLADMGQALLDGKIEAAIYNEGYTGIIDDAIEGYSEDVRILYQYGIDTIIEADERQASVEEPFNVYISGIDVAGPITTNSRSDVNIIMTVNPKTKQILLTSTPRDYYVKIPNISGDSKDKLTHAGIYGVDASIATLESIYDIDIDYYARVNFTSLVTIVDALGGVDVNSDYEFTTRHGNYHIEQGVNHMDGEMALGFARERYAFEDGDNQRGKDQEALLTAILRKAMSPAILTNANEILASVSDCVQTNMTSAEMAQLVNMQLSDPGTWRIESVAAEGTDDRQACYSSGSQILYVMEPDMESVEAISKQMHEVLGDDQ